MYTNIQIYTYKNKTDSGQLRAIHSCLDTGCFYLLPCLLLIPPLIFSSIPQNVIFGSTLLPKIKG